MILFCNVECEVIYFLSSSTRMANTDLFHDAGFPDIRTCKQAFIIGLCLQQCLVYTFHTHQTQDHNLIKRHY
jgi:hypothetical protein